MHVHVLLFGIIADLTGESKISLAIEANATVKNLKTLLKEKYPQLNSYNTYAVAVNESYALDDVLLKDSDTIAIIPPVSGG
ncbi:molybdopterin converting factor subunit 1 [Flavicella sediminum]|uniref:molybdopterin converting factor subunit 1 n=1 Tax=Flavicella sediminum TaxID=2585141 RepID=UPI00111D837F|nr:molybdopterin converting factor subunit 1 [Flavicella sediminum]